MQCTNTTQYIMSFLYQIKFNDYKPDAYNMQNEHKQSSQLLGQKFYLFMVSKFWGFHNSMVQASVLLGYDMVSLGNQFLAFQRTEYLHLQRSTVPRRMPDMTSRGEYVGTVWSVI